METCYRHPGRETGVSCSNCGRPICPDCMTPTPVGMRCPECARQTTKVRRPAAMAAQDPTLTYVFIGISVLVFLGEMLTGASATGGRVGGSDLIAEGGVSRPSVADGEVWRVVTAGFLHGGLFHLMFNMFALWVLGSMLEPAIGRARFAVVYFVSVLAGSFGALLLSPVGLTVGASGGIFGLMGAALVIMRHRGIDPMASGLPLWLGLNLAITFTIPGISVGGHLGGLAGGALAAFVMFDVASRMRLRGPVPALLASAVGALAIVGSVVVAGA
jgi:membrane associated rhomboid family serine protease